MAHITARNAIPFGALTVHRMVTAVTNRIEAVRHWSRRRRTVAELSRLSPRQLEDIGLTPADVRRMADGDR